MLGDDAENGERAVEIMRDAVAREEPYDLAILDMQMPGLDGVQLARAIREDTALRSTRMVMLTSMGRRGDGEEAREAGVEAYLTKPVRQAELRVVLARVLGSRSESASTGPAREDQSRVTCNSSFTESQASARAHLLVAEDNPVNQKVALRMLERLGYSVDVADDGKKALEALEGVPYDAVLMDVQMPEMDGYEATAELRRREADGERHTPVIAMTANALQGDREDALAAGMDDYISKPVKAEDLEAILARWVSRSDEETEEENPAAQENGAVDPSLPVVDYGVIDELRQLQLDGEPDLLAELVEVFVEDASARLKTLREALNQADADGVAKIAHTLKGSAGNLGASRMAHLAAQLEERGRSGNLDGAEDLLGELDSEFEKANAELSTGLLKS